MTKTKIILICLSLFILIGAPQQIRAEVSIQEPSFHGTSSPPKQVSNARQKADLDNLSADHASHGLLFLAMVSLLAIMRKKR